MESLNPLAERYVGAVHYGSEYHAELATASVTLDHAVAGLFRLTLKAGHVLAVAMRTDRTFRPANLL